MYTDSGFELTEVQGPTSANTINERNNKESSNLRTKIASRLTLAEYVYLAPEDFCIPACPCLCCMSMFHAYAACPCFMFMLHVFEIETCISMLLVMLLVHAACPTLHVPAACPRCVCLKINKMALFG
jgi:hypothetical protein